MSNDGFMREASAANEHAETTSMKSLSMQEIEYEIIEDHIGVTKRFIYPSGMLFEEYRTHAELFGIPWVHTTRGKSPETGKTVTAVGIYAKGRKAIGVFAIGQMAYGVVAVGQLAVGLLIGIGQASTGLLALGQAAISPLFGLGQLVTGYVCIGQLGYGHLVLAQRGLGDHVWDMTQADPVAQKFFTDLLGL